MNSILMSLLQALRDGADGEAPTRERVLRVWPKVPFARTDAFDISLYTEPLPHEAIDPDEYLAILSRLHPGLDRERASAMLARQVVFCAGDEARDPPRLAALVQARVVTPGEPLAADSLHFDRAYDDDFVRGARASVPSLVCNNAATLPGAYEGRGLTKRLITSVVLPYLAQHPTWRNFRWMTSSPMPDMPRCARLLASSPCVGDLAEIVDGALRQSAPFGYSSLADLLSESELFLREFQLLDPEVGDVISLRRSGCVDGFTRVLRSLLTERELADDSGPGAERASHYAALVDRLATPCGADVLGQSHAATKVLSFILVAAMQCDLYIDGDGESGGKAIDLTTRFHRENGGLRGGPPLPFARRQHRTSWTHGQQFVYLPDHARHASEYARVVAERRAAARRRDARRAEFTTLEFDRAEAGAFLRDTFARVEGERRAC